MPTNSKKVSTSFLLSDLVWRTEIFDFPWVFEDKIDYLKTVDILFLDDLGGESQSSFIRDEVLGPILQHRVFDELPTFFSSIMKMKDLTNALVADNSLLEKSKAHRIYERIKELADEFEISEKPHRTP